MYIIKAESGLRLIIIILAVLGGQHRSTHNFLFLDSHEKYTMSKM